jgi:glycosyltransferase involved in cell wall biosynthesis
MRVAILTTDNREHHRKYELAAPYFGPAIEALLQGMSQRADLEVHVISCTQQPMRAPEKLAANTFFHLLHVPKIGWLRTGYQGCIRAIRRKLREIKPDIVHGQGTERECALAAVFSGFPNIITLHGIMMQVAPAINARPGSYYWLAAMLERFALPRTLGVFCNSTYTESTVRSRARRTWLVPNALRQQFFDASVGLRSKSAQPILLNVGTVAPYKRQLALLHLAEELHREGHSFQMRFVGTAEGRSDYVQDFLRRVEKDRAFALHINPKSAEDLIAEYDNASGLIHVPSEEAFGLVVAEALARNLKFFGTRIGGLTDIAANIEGAELFELPDRQGLRAAIANWLKAGSAKPISAASAMRLRYSPDVIAAQHLEIYRELIERQ